MAMLPEPWGTVLTLVEAGAGIATAGAFIIALRSYRRLRKTEQIKLVEGIYKDIRQFEKERTEISRSGDNEAELNTWHSRYFNTLEWLAYLTNRNEVSYCMVKEVFDQLIKDSYGFMLPKYKDNSKELPEFKKLYKRIERH